MLIKIHKNRSVSSSGTWGTKNENNYEILNFEFPKELEEYNKRIVYYLDNTWVWDVILDNKAILTNTITTKGSVKAYIWCTKTDSQYETDVDFRTQLFEMKFFENENASGIVPTEEQVDGFNTMLTAMSNKIDEMDALEKSVKQAEKNREQRTDEAIENIVDMTAEYNKNAQEKTDAFDKNAAEKTETLNQIAEGIEDMTTAIQFASFEVDNDMHLNIIQAERMPNTNFLFNPDTGRLGVRIYNG